jgi:transcription antitermination protein NusB
MGSRRKARELALQMLFQADLGHQTAEEVRNTFWAERSTVDPDVQSFTDDIFHTALEKLPVIDRNIEVHAENWRMDRMAAVDRNILRSGVAEMMAFPGTPTAVVINEALEIAHKFSTPESVHFINGVLDSVARDLKRASGDGPAP